MWLACCARIVTKCHDSISRVQINHKGDDGRWMSGEYHVHTVQSNDASEPSMKLENVLNAAFRENIDKLPTGSVS